MADETFLTFDETMARLGLSEEELMSLVASNELRAFMKNREMHFKEADVAAAAGGAAPATAGPSVKRPTIVGAPKPPAEEDVVLIEDEGAGMDEKVQSSL
ncbi:MAG: helix-turn-helix domain-containing protein, partial [Planctomycetota bacterium]